MRSMTHIGGLFDNLYLSSFGFGGDPNDVARLRVEKNKWYNFAGLYRRDENFFDFNLFANPLNLNPGIGAALKVNPGGFDPTTMPWFANSPHLQDLTRQMGDFNLTLFPQSAIRFRLGFARNNSAGRLDTTLESPIRTLMTEYDQWRSDRYQFGVDLRLTDRTTISFDQFYEHDKVDPNFRDNNLSFTDSVTGAPIDIGIPLPPSGCSIVPGVTFPGGNVLVTSSKCNIGLFSFSRSGQVRTGIPTSQLSLQSNYFRKLDLTASGTYSSGRSDFLNYQEFANSRNGVSLLNATSHTDRVSGNADLGLTYHLARSWSVADKFRWLDWRNPGNSNQMGFTCSGTGAPGLILANAGCATPDPSSSGLFDTLLAERTYSNTARVNWDPGRRLSAYLGYRYGRRELTGALQGDSPVENSYYLVQDGMPAPLATNNALPATLNITKINEHTALGGIVFRPKNGWRVNADLELLSADNGFTNLSPRHQQRLRANTTYKVNRWASVNGGVHLIETRNDFAQSVNASSDPTNPNLFPTTGPNTVPPAYGHQDHWRYYTFGASLHPDRRFGFDLGWTYLDQQINSATCVPSTGPTVQATPALCNGFQPGGLPLLLNYQERTNSGFASLTVRPIHRVALSVGYEITSTAGHNNWLLPGGSDGSGILLTTSDIYGNSPPLAGNPTAPCPAASTTIAGGCGFAGPFPDAPLSQALNWHKPTASVAIDVAKGITLKGNYSYYDYNEKETLGLPLVTLPRNFHANTETIYLKYAF
jgi:opacity protein-like surface antigen